MDAAQAPPGANSIGGNASGVLQNSGIVIGDVKLYASDSEDPDELFETGLHRLHGNMPRKAALSFSAAYDRGMRESRLWFYWALAILSGRSDMDLDAESYAELSACLSAVEAASTDPFDRATIVVKGLFELSMRIRETEMEALTEEDRKAIMVVLELLRKLSDDRKSEITRHLDRVIDGTIMDLSMQMLREQLQERRSEHARADRAPRFFLPDPMTPRPREMPNWTAPGAWGVIVGGAALALLAGAILYFGADTTAQVLTAAGAIAALALIVRCAPAMMLRRERVKLRARHYQGSATDMLWVRWPQVMAFRDRFAQVLEYAFREQAPPGRAPEDWLAETGQARLTLSCRTAERYGDQDDMETLYWLAYHYADQFADASASGLLHHKDAGVSPVSPMAKTGLVGAGALLALATAGAAALSEGWGAVAAVIGGLTFAPAIALLGYHGLRIGLRRRFDEERRRWAKELFTAELAQYDHWREWLRNRPSDMEMSDWLDADLTWLRMQAMNELRLTHHDVLAHFAITEPDPFARAARVPDGPIRYSKYRLRTFLLTHNGVRIYSADLDFNDGSHLNPSMDNFRYDMIISAELVKSGVRYGRTGAALVDRNQIQPNMTADVALAHEMKLALHGRFIRIVIENQRYQNFAPQTPAEEKALLDLAMETSGAVEGLRILQSIAGEGRDWIVTERARHRRFIDRELFTRNAAINRIDRATPAIESHEPAALPAPRRTSELPIAED
ncbi:hypothetical protein [Glycomyces sp. NPDC021274]|uniref:hypothetical protein n=1 Tax=Glycomyces sp. NPDC021274 TaxID=3155120 RepID=UPI00340F3C39